MTSTFLLAQDQATRDAISQQIRDQINAARQEAQAAARAATAGALAPTSNAPPGRLQLAYDPSQGPPPSVVVISIAFFVTVAAVLIFWPVFRAVARKIERGGTTPKIPAELSGQLAQLTQAIDAIALEIERISEGQRFTTRLLSEQRVEKSGTILSPVAGAEARPANQG